MVVVNLQFIYSAANKPLALRSIPSFVSFWLTSIATWSILDASLVLETMFQGHGFFLQSIFPQHSVVFALTKVRATSVQSTVNASNGSTERKCRNP